MPFFWTFFVILVSIGSGFAETRLTVVGGNNLREDSFSPQYTVPVAMKDESPLLTEELERLPSVFFKESGAGEGSLNFRGLSGRHTLVFLDEIPLNDLAFGEVNFSQFLSGSTHPKSIIPGANGVLYGEGALGGVVLLETPFTKKSDKYLHGEVGSFDSAYGHGSVQEKGAHSRFIIHGEGARSSGISQYGPTRTLGEKNKYGRLGSAGIFEKGTTSRQVKLTARIMESTGKYDDDPSNPSSKPQGTKNFKMILVGAEGKVDVRNLSHKLNLFLNETDSKDGGIFGKFSSDTTLVGGRYEGSLFWTKESVLKLLTDLRQNTYKTETNLRKTGTDYGVGLQQTHNFDSHWSGEVGGRLTQNHQFGTYATYSLAGAYKYNQTTVKSSLKTGFAPPTFRELYMSTLNYRGNPSLKPEKARTFDVGVIQEFFQKKANFQVLYFQTEVKDLIVYSGKTSINSPTTTNLSGVETALSATLKEGLDLYVNYTLTQTPSPRTAVNIGFPRHKGAAGITWRFGEDWSLNNQVLYIGKRLDRLSKKSLDSYYAVKVSLDYNLSPTSKIYGRVENIFNSNCVQTYGYRSAKRTFYVGSSLYF